MNQQEERIKRNSEMIPYKSEFSFISFLKNFSTISKVIGKYKKEFLNFTVKQNLYDNLKKDFEEKNLKGFGITNFSEWAGTSISKNPLRLLRISTVRFLKSLLKRLKKTNTSYEIFNKILYHYYYKYSLIGTLFLFSFPFSYLAVNKNFQKFGIYRFLPLSILLCFSGSISDSFGDIGISKNSILILFILDQNLSKEDDELRNYLDEFLKEKNIKFVKKTELNEKADDIKNNKK